MLTAVALLRSAARCSRIVVSERSVPVSAAVSRRCRRRGCRSRSAGCSRAFGGPAGGPLLLVPAQLGGGGAVGADVAVELAVHRPAGTGRRPARAPTAPSAAQRSQPPPARRHARRPPARPDPAPGPGARPGRRPGGSGGVGHVCVHPSRSRRRAPHDVARTEQETDEARAGLYVLEIDATETGEPARRGRRPVRRTGDAAVQCGSGARERDRSRSLSRVAAAGASSRSRWRHSTTDPPGRQRRVQPGTTGPPRCRTAAPTAPASPGRPGRVRVRRAPARRPRRRSAPAPPTASAGASGSTGAYGANRSPWPGTSTA